MANRKSTLDSLLADAPGGELQTQLIPKEDVQALRAKADAEYQKSIRQTAENHSALIAEKRVDCNLAPMYAPWFGDVMTVSLNGIPIYFPVDGRTYAVPESYARIIHERRRSVDRLVTRQKRMANVQENRENFAGELVLLPK